MQAATRLTTICYHCGETCSTQPIKLQQKHFCCEGCKSVYVILSNNNLCNYYALNQNPGAAQRVHVRKEKFAYLDDVAVANKLIHFQNKQEAHVTFYLPQIHCSSCLWLLENLHTINTSIISSRVSFTKKEVTIIYSTATTSIRAVVELLTSVGYEPYISLQNMQPNAKPATNKPLLYQLAVAGFCFGNIMLLSFPEYLGLPTQEVFFSTLFRYLNIILALPVLLYSAQPFYKSTLSSIQHKYITVDAPVAVAIILTFVRSMYDVFVLEQGGYFDSMSGIVFFMLVGRWLQNKTYEQLNFTRDYTSYFPISVDVIKDGKEVPTQLKDITVGNTIVIYNEGLIPVDGLLTKGTALIDYSFVTGESNTVVKEMGELIYAGGKQTNGRIEILVMKEVAQSYLTALWNKTESKQKIANQSYSYINYLNKYFSVIVALITAIACIYWTIMDASRIIDVVTTILIVACPCALILAETFTNGTILGILGGNKIFIKNAAIIDKLAKVNHIVVDKTGTLTTTKQFTVSYHGVALSTHQQKAIASLAANSTHPLSKALLQYMGITNYYTVQAIAELPGLGMEGFVNGELIQIGSAAFMLRNKILISSLVQHTVVYVAIEEKLMGYFSIQHQYRNDILWQLQQLQSKYAITVLSGDNNAQQLFLQQQLGNNTQLLFLQSPQQKKVAIEQIQASGASVLMIGDGLNDAAALQAADVGMAVAENTHVFTPASDAIVAASALALLPKILKMAKANTFIITVSFIVSIVYNIIGLTYALQGKLSPLVAAILMPASTISIVLLTYTCSRIYSRHICLQHTS